MTDAYAVAGYLAEGPAGGLARAERTRDGVPVLVKFTRAELPSPREAERLRHEYEILSQLRSSWTPRPYGLERQRGQLWLVLEGVDGEPLSGLLGGADLGRCLDVAVGLSAALVDVHHHGIVHGDLRPDNVLFDPRTAGLKLLGFGMAGRLSDVPVAPARPIVFEGSPAHMSPEQTGYLNRGVDHRSDLYSLGVILYELLTGELPFQATDPVEWAHCHVARPPTPPHEIAPTVPAVLSELVLRLLAKQPEERYQSAQGLTADLQRCRQEWRATGAVTTFPLGTQDTPDRLLIPNRLYGRDREAAAITACFERVRGGGGSQLVLVCGYSGIGKSSLVQELRRPVLEARGYFASGKDDQYRRDVPYSTLVRALHGLIQQILAESDERLDAWRGSLREALGGNGGLMVELVPQLDLLVGPQPPVPAMSPRESQQRLQFVLARFLGVFARRRHPLVLFLDDLQWVDPATLRLMGDLLTSPEIEALLLVGAYRDNEVGPSHPLTAALEKLRRNEVHPEELVLGPLPPQSLTQLVADTLRRPTGTVAPLARLIHSKTEGNPFFAIHFLTTLHEEGLLFREGGWKWDLRGIRRKGFTDNVVDLMLDKLKRLPKSTRRVLTLAACLAGSVDAGTLALLDRRTEAQIEDILRPAMDAGLISRAQGTYTFLHDRVQEAAYALLPADRRPALHLRIGRTLLAHTPQEQLAENVFEVVGQLNRGVELTTAGRERRRLAELNLLAGQRAKRASAFASALPYLTAGIAALGSGSWEGVYDLTFCLHVERAECEYLVGNYAMADTLLAQAIDHARTLLDRTRAYRLQVRLCQLSGHLPEAMDAFFKALRLFGVTLPEDPQAAATATEAEFQLAYDHLRGSRIADLVDVPLSDDPEVRALIGLLSEAMPVTYVTRPALWPLVVAKAVNVCLQRGHAEESPFVYSTYTMVLAGVRRDIESARQFSELALQLNERLPNGAAWRGQLLLRLGSVITVWTRHFAHGLPILDQAFDACVESGDLVFAGYTTNNAIWVHLENGDRLDEVASLAHRYAAFAQHHSNEVIHHLDRLMEQFAQGLRGATRSLTDFSDDGFDEAESVEAMTRADFGRGMAFYFIMKQVAAFHAERFDEALEWADRARPILRQVAAIAAEATYQFYRALTCAALHGQRARADGDELAAQLQEPLEMLRFWAGHCPENFADRQALVQAELARLQGRDSDAMRLFQQAVTAARDSGFVHQEALAFELASRFYRSRGLDWIALAHLRQARDCYARWGADGKVRQLDRRHPDLVERSPHSPALISAGAERFDLWSVVKASQAISQEIMLPQLQETLIRLALEHAGAQRGYLLLADDQQLTIHASAQLEGDRIRVDVLPGLPATPGTVPMTLLNYLRHSRDTVVLTDPTTDTRYAGDEYFSQHRPRSVLGLPITRQGRLIGILYLENDLVTGAFVPAKLTVLELLAAQAAISLDVARLYTALQEENAERAAAERALRVSQERARQQYSTLRGIIDSLNAPVFSLDRHYRYTSFNHAHAATMKTLYGADIELGHDILGYLTAPGERQTAKDDLDRTLAGDQLMAEFSSEDPSGSRTYFQVSYSPIRDEAGQVIGVAVLAQDITARRHAEDAIRELNQDLEQRVLDRTRQLQASTRERDRAFRELQQAHARILQQQNMASIGQLAAGMAHEINTPTQYLTHNLDFLTQSFRHLIQALPAAPPDPTTAAAHPVPDATPDPDMAFLVEEVPRALRESRDGVNQIVRIISAMKDFARPGRNRPEPTDLPHLIGNVVEMSHNEWAPVARLDVTVDPQACTLTCLPDRLGHVLLNLILNASHAIADAHRPPGDGRIQIRVQRDGNNTEIQVQDNGCGIPTDLQPRIFEPFFTTRPVGQGSGQGLAIAYDIIVNTHHGHINVDSTPDAGTTFTLHLPTSGPPPPDQGHPTSDTQPDEGPRSAWTSESDPASPSRPSDGHESSPPATPRPG